MHFDRAHRFLGCYRASERAAALSILLLLPMISLFPHQVAAERKITKAVVCHFQNAKAGAAFSVHAYMLSDTKFHDRGYYVSKGDEVNTSISQKKPRKGEMFYLTVNEDDPEFELDLRIYKNAESNARHRATATMYVDFQEWGSMDGFCNIHSN